MAKFNAYFNQCKHPSFSFSLSQRAKILRAIDQEHKKRASNMVGQKGIDITDLIAKISNGEMQLETEYKPPKSFFVKRQEADKERRKILRQLRASSAGSTLSELRS